MTGEGLVVRGLTKSYGKGRTPALGGIDLDVSDGLYGLLGPNGAGKSTLMRTLATLLQPDAGGIALDGVDVLRDGDYLRRRLGYLPQTIGAYPGVPADRLLERFAWLKGITDRAARRREVDALLDRVNLHDASCDPVSTYSGGMLRRFGIAIALIGAPRLLIVDEPTAGLDPAERNRFHRMLADVAAETIVLLSTHIVEDIENLCERVAVLVGGRIVTEGRIADLTAPLDGKLWSRMITTGSETSDALHLVAVPGGTRAIIHCDTAPSDGYERHRPSLEDVYHLALGRQVAV
jgi:ABC-type multidrug transport system ATPase subunit